MWYFGWPAVLFTAVKTNYGQPCISRALVCTEIKVAKQRKEEKGEKKKNSNSKCLVY